MWNARTYIKPDRFQLRAVRSKPPSYVSVPRSNLSLNQRKSAQTARLPDAAWDHGLSGLWHGAGVRINATSTDNTIDDTIVTKN